MLNKINTSMKAKLKTLPIEKKKSVILMIYILTKIGNCLIKCRLEWNETANVVVDNNTFYLQ